MINNLVSQTITTSLIHLHTSIGNRLASLHYFQGIFDLIFLNTMHELSMRSSEEMSNSMDELTLSSLKSLLK
jgi:hypothetical protein